VRETASSDTVKPKLCVLRVLLRLNAFSNRKERKEAQRD
jgi:hypothetical protein